VGLQVTTVKGHRIVVPFEGKDVEVELPRRWSVVDRVQPSTQAGLEDLRAALIEALEHPFGCGALRGLDGKKILIAVDDISRPTPTHRYFGALVEYLVDRGARRDDMLIVTALGIHRPMTQEELEGKLGREAIEGLSWVNHDARDSKKLVALGRTSRGTEVSLNEHLPGADLIVCVGAIEPHLLLGFGGGLKMIVPGLAAEQTIAQNHMQGVTADRFNYVGADISDMRLDLEEAAQKVGKPYFIVNAIMNERLEVCRFVCGDPIAAHREGIATVRGINARPIPRHADVAIVASSPMNADLRQGMKSIGNIEQSVRENGLVLAFLDCNNGIGDLTVPPKALPMRVMRVILRLLGRHRVLWFIDKVKRNAGVEERFLAHFSMQVVRKNEIYVYSKKLPPDTGKKLGIFRQFDDVDEMMAAAQRYAPRRAQVLVYPHGGVTYPILP
jgi:nickel-dependent lactate racemase